VAIGSAFDNIPLADNTPQALGMVAAEQLSDNETHWRSLLGDLAFENTMSDLAAIANRPG
jgi:hypothetical protein